MLRSCRLLIEVSLGSRRHGLPLLLNLFAAWSHNRLVIGLLLLLRCFLSRLLLRRLDTRTFRFCIILFVFFRPFLLVSCEVVSVVGVFLCSVGLLHARVVLIATPSAQKGLLFSDSPWTPRLLLVLACFALYHVSLVGVLQHFVLCLTGLCSLLQLALQHLLERHVLLWEDRLLIDAVH